MVVCSLLNEFQMFLKCKIILFQISFEFDGGKSIGRLDFTPEDRNSAPALHEWEVMILDYQNLFSFYIISRIALVIDSPCKTLCPSTFDCAPTNQDDCQFKPIDVHLQSANKTLDHWYTPQRIEPRKFLLQVECPVETRFLLLVVVSRVHP